MKLQGWDGNKWNYPIGNSCDDNEAMSSCYWSRYSREKITTYTSTEEVEEDGVEKKKNSL